MCSRIQSTSLRTRASGRPRAASAMSRHLVEQRLLARERRRRRRRPPSRRGRLDLRVLLGRELVLGQRRRGRRRRPAPSASSVERAAALGVGAAGLLLRQCARRSGGGRAGCGRTPRSRRAAAAAGRRSSSAAAACARLRLALAAAPRAAARYSSSSVGQPQLGRVGRQAVDVDLLDDRASGSRPAMLAEVLLEPADHDVVEQLRARTGTPRQNRCGSRISSRAEKLFEWPLCGVAERNSRCSKRGARSRTARVSCESMAYARRSAGAAWWASSRISSEPGRKSPSQSRSGAA